MLVLHRKAGEQIVINGGEIVIQVVDCSKKGVRLGFSASQEHTIHRAEVQEAIDAERANDDRD